MTGSAPIVVYVTAMVVAGWSTTASLILYFAIPVLYFAMIAFVKADPRTKAEAGDLS